MSFDFWKDSVVHDDNALASVAGAKITGVTGLKEGSQEIRIQTDKGLLVLLHHQDCCEHVSVEDVAITGDESDLIGARILECREDSKFDDNTDYGDGKWTFYNIVTDRADVNIRWYGSSNGYYSISVSVGFDYDKLPEGRVDRFQDEAANLGYLDWC